MDSAPSPSSSVPDSHIGILREENVALRQILGYRLEANPPFTVPSIGRNLPGTSIKDVLLVSIDVDTGRGYEVISPGQSFHIGISIFDTRHLTTRRVHVDDAIVSYQFINRDTKPCQRAARAFLFGKTDLIELTHLAAKFMSLTQGRDYVIVAHGVHEDLKFFDNICRGISRRASYIMDTVKAAQYPLQLSYRHSLEKLLEKFEIRFAKLHAAGNDAHFALRALLMTAVCDGRLKPETMTAMNEEVFQFLDAVAHAPFTLPTLTENPPEPSNGDKKSAGGAARKKTRNKKSKGRQARVKRRAAERKLQKLSDISRQDVQGVQDKRDGEDGQGGQGGDDGEDGEDGEDGDDGDDGQSSEDDRDVEDCWNSEAVQDGDNQLGDYDQDNDDDQDVDDNNDQDIQTDEKSRVGEDVQVSEIVQHTNDVQDGEDNGESICSWTFLIDKIKDWRGAT